MRLPAYLLQPKEKNMRESILVPLFLFFLLCVPAPAQTAAPAETPTRKVKGQSLISAEMPAVRLDVGKDFKYVGGHKFILYDVAHAEQHFFVDADKDGRVKRLYWVQFEGYLPTNTHTYNYKGAKTVNIGGLDFFADVYARNIKANPGRPDSDAAKGRAFLESKGYRFGSDEIISQRFLHYIGEEKRNELMIIYLEDMTPLGVTAADLAKGGKREARMPEISESFLSRALKDIKLVRTN